MYCEQSASVIQVARSRCVVYEGLQFEADKPLHTDTLVTRTT